MRAFLFSFFILSSLSLLAQNTMFDICPLKVGSEIPEGIVMDANSQEHELTNLIAERPTVIIFYRGAWCGYCTRHLAELNDAKADIEAKGFQIFGVTIDQASKLEESQSRSESEITVYSDAKAELIKAFGLDWQVSDELFTKYKTKYNLDLEEWSGEDHHALPVPAVFIIKDGVVQFQYVNPNYNTRMKAETLLAILGSL